MARWHIPRQVPIGGSHSGTGGDRYLKANRPSEGNRAARQAFDDPSCENIAHYLRVHIDDESLVTNELVGYIHRAHTSLRLPSLGHAAARTRNRSLTPASTLRVVSVAIVIPSRPWGTK